MAFPLPDSAPLQRPLHSGSPTREDGNTDAGLSPSQAFAAICAQPGAFWLDSGDRRGPHARYHHMGCCPTSTYDLGTDPDTDPFDALEALAQRAARGPTDRPAPRLVGFLNYDLGRYVERVPCPKPTHGGPEAWFGVYDAVASWDLETGEAWVTASSAAAAEALEARLAGPALPAAQGPLTQSGPEPVLSTDAWGQSIARILEYIAAGDVYQVNLSRRFEATLAPDAGPADLYRRLRSRHSACFGAYLNAGEVALVSNSPEAFLDWKGGAQPHVASWPLKGTRPHGSDPEALRSDPKERAEHVMIVDLLRNDLGRIAVPGTVQVPELMQVVSHPTVLHLESRIQAEPRPGTGLAEVLRATFPGGSITGAPKIRAMEIIAELERERRGVYCGALGYVGWNGDTARFSIPIRTALIEGRRLTFRSGGGIVADSDAGRELQETVDKARAFLEVLAR